MKRIGDAFFVLFLLSVCVAPALVYLIARALGWTFCKIEDVLPKPKEA